MQLHVDIEPCRKPISNLCRSTLASGQCLNFGENDGPRAPLPAEMAILEAGGGEGATPGHRGCVGVVCGGALPLLTQERCKDSQGDSMLLAKSNFPMLSTDG